MVEQTLALVQERQIYGDHLIRLSEDRRSDPLTERQQAVLLHDATQLSMLGLQLAPELHGPPRLAASHVVGSARFVVGREDVIVQVEPKVGGTNFLRMLDYTLGTAQLGRDLTTVNIEQGNPVGLLLDFFSAATLLFLQRGSYRGYHFATSIRPGIVKGRPLVREYLIGSLPRATPEILPCRYLDFSADVLENQIIAFALHRAVQITALLPLTDARRVILARLRQCERLLPGVSLRRITVEDIKRLRYTRSNAIFQDIHRLCELIITNTSISLQAAQKIPFVSFALDMANLFESYITSLLANAFSHTYIGNQTRPHYSLDAYGKDIALDGLLTYKGQRVVVECKYKRIGRISTENEAIATDDFSIIGGRIRSGDIYQVIAYVSHREVRARAAILVYPTWTSPDTPLSIDSPITTLGWYTAAEYGVPLFFVGVSLAADFDAVVRSLRNDLPRHLDDWVLLD